MPNTDAIAGTLVQHEEPEWEPLRRLAGHDIADSFMWMHEVQLADGTRVHAYKHHWTRRYAHLTADGRAFAYTDRGKYRLQPAVASLLATLDQDDRELLPLGVVSLCPRSAFDAKG